MEDYDLSPDNVDKICDHAHTVISSGLCTGICWAFMMGFHNVFTPEKRLTQLEVSQLLNLDTYRPVTADLHCPWWWDKKNQASRLKFIYDFKRNYRLSYTSKTADKDS